MHLAGHLLGTQITCEPLPKVMQFMYYCLCAKWLQKSCHVFLSVVWFFREILSSLGATLCLAPTGGARLLGCTFRRNSHTAQKADVFSSFRHGPQQAGPIPPQTKWAILFHSSEDAPEIYPMDTDFSLAYWIVVSTYATEQWIKM